MSFDFHRAGAALLLALSSPALAQGGGSPETYVQLDSEPGDPVGSGLQWFYPNDTERIDYGVVGSNIGYAGHVAIFEPGNPFAVWSLVFADGSGAVLQPGEYEGAVMFNAIYDGHAMDVGQQGNHCTFLSGRFVVWSITTVDDRASVAIDFEQRCEGATGALFGQVRINFVAALMPVANAGGNQTVAEGSVASLDGRASSDNGRITAYRWTQQAGPPVTLVDADTSRLSIPDLPPAPATLILRLQVTDNEGSIDFDAVTLTVVPREPAGVRDYVGAPSAGGALGPAGLVMLLLAGLARSRRRA